MQEQAHGRRLEGLAGYTGLKSQVLQLSAIAIGLGTVALLALDGAESAAPFLGGGLTGLVYQRLLQLSVDAVPGGPTVSTQQQQQEVAPTMSTSLMLIGSCDRLDMLYSGRCCSLIHSVPDVWQLDD